jgi:hypothetical protein
MATSNKQIRSLILNIKEGSQAMHTIIDHKHECCGVSLQVNTNMIDLSEVSMNYTRWIWVENGLLSLVYQRTSHINFLKVDLSWNASTWTEHKHMHLLEMCTKHDEREYDCGSHKLIIHCID